MALRNPDHLPLPPTLVAKVGEADPPTLDAGQRLLDEGEAGQELQLVLGLGLGQEATLEGE